MNKKGVIICVVSFILYFIIESILLAAMLVFFVNQSDDKKDIIAYVKENHESLQANIEQSGMKKKKLKDIERIEKKDIRKIDENTMAFCWSAYGIAPSGSEYGFYYSVEDEPSFAVYWLDEDLTKDGDGYSYKEDSPGDNSYYTEKICDHFWYYEAEN